jgi:Reverse transcriptase (RNA-dependent DNA polymerase)
LLSNLYLNEVDKMLERAREVTRYRGFTVIEYVRFADDLVVLVSAHPNQRWLHSAVEKRLREEFAKLEVEVNEQKSRRVDLKRAESFSFLGFDFWRVRSRAGRWMPLYRPQMKKRTALLHQLKVVFRSLKSQPVRRVISTIRSCEDGSTTSRSVTRVDASRLFATGSSRRFGGTWPKPGCVEVSGGSGGIGSGCMMRSACLMTIECGHDRKLFQSDRFHNP